MAVRKRGNNITITLKQLDKQPAPTRAPKQQPVKDDEPSAEKAPRHRPPSWHRRAADRRSRFFEAKDNAAVEAALPEMLEEAAAIALGGVDVVVARAGSEAALVAFRGKGDLEDGTLVTSMRPRR